jgi:hypothetical protein
MMHADMPALQEENAAHLGRAAYDAMFVPLRTIFVQGEARGETRAVNADVMAGSFLAILDGIQFSGRRPDTPSRASMLDDVISVMLDGLRKRSKAGDGA